MRSGNIETVFWATVVCNCSLLALYHGTLGNNCLIANTNLGFVTNSRLCNLWVLLKSNQTGLRLEIASHSEANEVYIIIKQVGFKRQNNFNYSAMFMAFQEHVTKCNYS